MRVRERKMPLCLARQIIIAKSVAVLGTTFLACASTKSSLRHFDFTIFGTEPTSDSPKPGPVRCTLPFALCPLPKSSFPELEPDC